ncbi:MAG: AI-2E family transporter [Deltaproteobacteria bacterium]|nr:AI-2E family transporter [Deltaproteobacteria bacterium]
MKKESLFNLLFLALVILAFYLFYRILSPYLSTLAWAVILTIIFYPLFKVVNNAFHHRRGLAAIAMTIVVIVVIIIPSGFLLNLIANELIDVYNYCEQLVKEGRHIAFLEGLKKLSLFQRIWEVLDRNFDLSQVNLNTLLLDNLKKLSLYAAGQTSKFIKRLSTVIFQFFLMSLALFFLFRDGEKVMEKIKALIPFSSKEKENILRRMVEMIQATIYGGIVVALVQGGLGGLGFWILGLPAPLFWGAVMTFLSFLPVVGSFLVWVPAAVILFVQGSYIKALILFGWGAILVSLSDNFLRPLLISGRTQVHTLLLFFGILGGLKVFGFLGFVAGPLVITICLAIIDIYTSATDKTEA